MQKSEAQTIAHSHRDTGTRAMICSLWRCLGFELHPRAGGSIEDPAKKRLNSLCGDMGGSQGDVYIEGKVLERRRRNKRGRRGRKKERRKICKWNMKGKEKERQAGREW